MSKLYLFPLSDLHLGSKQCDLKFFDYWRKTFEKAPDNKVIYLLGDLLEFPRASLDAYNVNMTTHDALERVVELLSPYKEYVRYVVSGNHECFDEDTELLSSEGWITCHDLDENTLLATYNQESKELEWQYPLSINKEYVEEDLIQLQGRSIDTLTTKNHRFLYTYASDEKELNHMKLKEIQEIDISEIVLRQACKNNKEDYDISDDEIRLIAWCLTDSHYYNNVVTFYQRKSAVSRIEELLHRLNISYNYRERERDITHVCGKKLKNKPEVACELSVNLNDVKHLCSTHYKIPAIIWKLSKRQFIIFLEELIFCDGSKHKSSPDNSWMLYKSKEFLDEIQALCIANDIRTSLSQYRENHYRLNINPKYNRSRIKNNQNIIHYKGIIFCATVPNDTLIARRNGKVIITGNSRTMREHNFDISKSIAKRLDAQYSHSDFFDKIVEGDKEFVIYGKHGTKTSKNSQLAMNNFIRDMADIDANLYLQGHNHYCEFASNYRRGFNNGDRRYYAFTGHFLGYDGYARDKGLPLSQPSFLRLTVDKKLHIDAKKFYKDEVM